MSLGGMNHVQKVRLLYKSCLKLHRGLPIHFKAIGDTYVKDEFRRHKGADAQQTQIFMEAWAKYAIQISKQVGLKGPLTAKKLGEDLKVDDLDNFSEEQLTQLYELYSEAKKPIDPEKDPHLANI
eukprot:TRINITY_DN5411_c0_g1_i1.p1 TRINITY_DN5411_c0_g1~~TRINITY_DN5411_c0_g1_i1.p1  ORF type:complete len:125 (-),score=28.87 TRINITY_DN5411_c0_g1_i1:55-429(-)